MLIHSDTDTDTDTDIDTLDKEILYEHPSLGFGYGSGALEDEVLVL